MDYESASAGEIAVHFGRVSRQRVSQVIMAYKKKRRLDIVAKMIQAKAILRKTKYIAKNGCTVEVRRKCEELWAGMTLRAGNAKSYLDCTVGFENYAAFRAWAPLQVGFNERGFELDKDILVKGNRVYSAETCVFVPKEINAMLAGCYRASSRGQYPIGVCFNKGSGSFVAQMNKDHTVSLDKYLGSFRTVEEAFACYKQAKEAKIKRLAEKWKAHIDVRAYDALLARTVEWDD